MQKIKEHRITLRMCRQTQRAIKSSAVKNNRSLNSEIVQAIEHYLLGHYLIDKAKSNGNANEQKG